MPRIIYVCWPPREISGGIKTAFQHVELLVEAGYDAAIATPDGSEPDWFQSTAKVIAFDALTTTDVLVLPENNPRYFAAFARGAQPKVVFCQNPYHVHRGLAEQPSYANYGVTHIMCPSHNVMHFCAQRFPGMKLGYTPFFIDPMRFKFTPQKTLQVAAIPRKRQMEFGAIVDLLRTWHPGLGNIQWVYLHAVSEQDIATAMARSAVFLSLAKLEAHAMTTLEAMASGCIVAGFCGVYDGSDSATAKNGFWAKEDDVFGCVEQLARAIRTVQAGGEPYRLMLEEGFRTAQEYRREESARLLAAFWKKTFDELSLRA